MNVYNDVCNQERDGGPIGYAVDCWAAAQEFESRSQIFSTNN